MLIYWGGHTFKPVIIFQLLIVEHLVLIFQYKNRSIKQGGVYALQTFTEYKPHS